MPAIARRAPCPAPRASHAVAAACAALVAAGVLATADNLRTFTVQPDFAAYYLAARAHASGRSMYTDSGRADLARDLDLPLGAYSGTTWYLYPPALAVALRPLAALPYRRAAPIWLAANACLTALAVYHLLRLFRWTRARAALGAAGALLLPGTQQTLLHGQINWLPLAAAVFCIRDWAGGHGRTGSVLLGVASALKIFPVVFAVAAPRGRRARAWRVAALAAAIVFAAGWLAYDRTSFFQEWAHAFGAHAERSFASHASNQSLAAAVGRISQAVPSALVTTGALVIVLATIAGVWIVPPRRPRRVDVGLRISALTAAALIALPVSWDHYHVLLIPVAVVLLLAARRSPVAWALFLAGALLLLTHRFWRPLSAVAPSGVFLALGLAGALLWWGACAWLLLLRDAPARVAVKHA